MWKVFLLGIFTSWFVLTELCLSMTSDMIECISPFGNGLKSELEYQVIAPPTYYIFWLQAFSLSCHKGILLRVISLCSFVAWFLYWDNHNNSIILWFKLHRRLDPTHFWTWWKWTICSRMPMNWPNLKTRPIQSNH